MSTGIAGSQVAERVGWWREKRLWYADRQAHAEGVPQPGRVLDGCPAFRAADPHPDEAAGRLEIDQPAADRVPVAPLDASDNLVGGQRPEDADQVGHVLGIAGLPPCGEVLQLGLGRSDGRRVEQVAQGQASSLAEQLGEQRRVERQGRRLALGQGRVALVEELGDVPEHERTSERRGLLGLDRYRRHLSALDAGA